MKSREKGPPGLPTTGVSGRRREDDGPAKNRIRLNALLAGRTETLPHDGAPGRFQMRGCGLFYRSSSSPKPTTSCVSSVPDRKEGHKLGRVLKAHLAGC